MVNFGLNSASLLGIFLAVAGAGLYFLRSIRPELSRDHDIFFAAIGLLCGFILLFQGWRLDPILQFGQFLLTGSAIFFAVESIRMRGLATEIAKRNTPIVDDDRPVSSAYRYQAELEELEPVDERPVRRRIRGTPDSRNSRTDDYEVEDRRRTSSRGNDERLGSGERSQNKRRPRRNDRPPERTEDEWSSSNRSDNDWADNNFDSSAGVGRKPRRPSGSEPSSSPVRSSDTNSRPRRSRPPQASQPQTDRDFEAIPTDYVDYQPIDHPDEESDNSGNFDR
ncbi:MAG: Ycf66 family protein [Chamaesiphon sp.]